MRTIVKTILNKVSTRACGATRPPRSIEQECGLLDDRREVRGETARDIPVDDAVIERGRHRRDVRGTHLAVDDPRLLLDRTERDDAHLARVEDRRAGVHPERAEV